jgi:hypothetical protein
LLEPGLGDRLGDGDGLGDALGDGDALGEGDGDWSWGPLQSG